MENLTINSKYPIPVHVWVVNTADPKLLTYYMETLGFKAQGARKRHAPTHPPTHKHTNDTNTQTTHCEVRLSLSCVWFNQPSPHLFRSRYLVL